MARFDKSSTKRPKQDAAVAATRSAKRSTAPSIEDTMFFPRLRRHAKWMFVFLAVALGGGFVLFGVGAGGTGVGDILRGGGASSGVPSISSAQKKTEKNPKDVQAWTELSTALQTDGQTDEAIDAQKQVVVLAPKDTDALRELAASISRRRARSSSEAQLAQLRVAYQGAGQGFPGSLVSPTGQSLVDDRISVVINSQSSAAIQKLAGEAQAASAEAVGAYKKIAALQPNDPNIQLELAQAAQQAGDAATAIAAYTAFLKLAPDDPNASIVKQQLKQLKQTSAVVGLDSRHMTSTSLLSRAAAARPRCRVAVVIGGAVRGRLRSGRSATRREPVTGPRARSCSSRSAAAVTRSPTPAPRARSGRTSTTRSSSRGASGLGESTFVQVVRGQIAYPITKPSTGAPGHAGEHRRGPGRGRHRQLRRERRRRRQPERVGTAHAARRRPRTPPAGGGGGGGRRRGRQGGVHVGRVRRLPHARRCRLERHRRPESRRREARRRPRDASGSRTARASMPSFKGQLTRPQIADVAAYVSSVAGK